MAELRNYLERLEKYLQQNVFSNFPQLPDYIEDPLLKYLPFVCLLLGLLCLFSAYDLWNTAHTVNSLVVYANNFKWTTGIQKTPINDHMGPAFWLGLISLVIEAFLFFKAIPGANSKLKSGWNFIYYALVLNVFYGIFMLFSTYGGFGNLVERALFSLFCLYLLFEITDSFRTPRSGDKKHPKKISD